jgi:hypothetical protein
LKIKSLGLASVQRTIARQELRLLWLKEGDAPTCFFHIQASLRHRKNFIHALEHQGQRLVAKDRKADAAFDFFDEILGASYINLDCLELNHINLSSLGERFTESEVWGIIRLLPPDKARSGWVHRVILTVDVAHN